jgi:hypothetical protein
MDRERQSDEKSELEEDYSAPSLHELGTAEELTQGNTSGSSYDPGPVWNRMMIYYC